MGVFNIFKKKKDLNLPSAVFLCGMLGVGKTTLAKNVILELKKYNFERTCEFKTSEELDKILGDNSSIEKRRRVIFRNNINYFKGVVDLLRNKNKNVISDCLPFGEVFLSGFENSYAKFGRNKLDSDEIYQMMVSTFETQIRKFNITDEELKKTTFILVKNSNNKNQFYSRGYLAQLVPYVLFDDYKKCIEESLQRFGRYLHNKGCTYFEFDTSKFNIESKNFRKFFVEKVLTNQQYL